MKRWLNFLVLVVAVMFCATILQAAEADTLLVPATDGEGAPIVNALIQYVVADTNANGEQLHDVYKLERGKYYFYNQSPVFTNPITLVADEPGTTSETKPPKIIITTDAEGGVPYAHCITTWNDITCKNIAFSTTTQDEGYSWANIIKLHAENKRIVMEGCHFTVSGWGLLEAYVDGVKFYIDKCHIRNATSPDSWCPFFFEGGSSTIDTLICRNTTFFNMVGSPVNYAGQARCNYFEFDHCTLVNIVRLFSSLNSYSDATITNNIFYNTMVASVPQSALADAEDHAAGQASVIDVDTLAANDPDASDSLAATSYIDEGDRRIDLKNNCYFWSQEVVDLHTQLDSTVAPKWMTDRALSMFGNDAVYPYLVDENNINEDPEFVNFGGTDKMVDFVYNIYAGGGIDIWGWDPDSVDYPDYHYANLQWPLPEDFSHSLSQMGTDGYPIGSLEYYPNELESYYEDLSSVDKQNDLSVPSTFALGQNYPNPFNPITSIDYRLNSTNDVKLIVYNSLGQKIRTLVSRENVPAGSYSIEWNGKDDMGQTVSSGIYIYKLQMGSQSMMKKMILMK
ncbi:MAG: T9SS type A sorting domain-containing protein [bacterium]